LSATDIHVSSVHGVITYPNIPKSLQFLLCVDVSKMCNSVCSYEENIYIGLRSHAEIVRLDDGFTVTKSFTADESVYSFTVYKNKLYALTRCNSYSEYEVKVYTLHGYQVTSWIHRDESMSKNELAIIDDQVVIPNKESKMMTIYSLAGKVEKHIPCSLLNKYSSTFICTADKHCVVVSDYNSSQVFKVNLTTEKIIWTCKSVSKPHGVTCYESKYVLVTNGSIAIIWILDVKTG